MNIFHFNQISRIIITPRLLGRCTKTAPWTPSLRHTSRSELPKETEIAYKEQWQWAQPEGHDTGIQIKNSYYCIRKGGPHVTVPFIVENPHYVTWYACGPTVYDSSHVGHASTYLQFDIIRRILTKYFGLNICMVMGITNMDNKIVNRALLYDRDVMEVADTYETEFKRAMKSLNILPPTTYIRVTDIIPQIIDYIEKLIDKKLAYITEKGNVYFSYNSAHQNVAKLYKEFHEADVATTEKRFVKDICLWKSANGGEPYWDAPWGKGRPGWHIECSVMASMCFGEKVDIHTGAIDLRFPHHEYEIAQCDAYFNCHQWVNYFLHSGHMTVHGGAKMSKSLGNFLTIEDFVKVFEEPDILRMLCSSNLWYKNIVFSPGAAQHQRQTLNDLTAVLKLCHKIINGTTQISIDDSIILESLAKCEEGIMEDFRANFAVPSAMGRVRSLARTISEAAKETETNSIDNYAIVKATNFIETFLDNLGFTFHRR